MNGSGPVSVLPTQPWCYWADREVEQVSRCYCRWQCVSTWQGKSRYGQFSKKPQYLLRWPKCKKKCHTDPEKILQYALDQSTSLQTLTHNAKCWSQKPVITSTFKNQNLAKRGLAHCKNTATDFLLKVLVLFWRFFLVIIQTFKLATVYTYLCVPVL